MVTPTGTPVSIFLLEPRLPKNNRKNNRIASTHNTDGPLPKPPKNIITDLTCMTSCMCGTPDQARYCLIRRWSRLRSTGTRVQLPLPGTNRGAVAVALPPPGDREERRRRRWHRHGRVGFHRLQPPRFRHRREVLAHREASRQLASTSPVHRTGLLRIGSGKGGARPAGDYTMSTIDP